MDRARRPDRGDAGSGARRLAAARPPFASRLKGPAGPADTRDVPISRPLLIALIGVVLVGAVVLVTRGGGDDAASTASVEPTAPETLQAAEPPAGDQSKRPGSSEGGPSGGADSGLPRDVSRALARGRPMVIGLFQGGAGDDSLTEYKTAVAEARPGRHAKADGAVFFREDKVRNTARYVELTGPLGVSQAPALIVVGTDGDARVLEGFTDTSSLRQHLTDALR